MIAGILEPLRARVPRTSSCSTSAHRLIWEQYQRCNLPLPPFYLHSRCRWERIQACAYANLHNSVRCERAVHGQLANGIALLCVVLFLWKASVTKNIMCLRVRHQRHRYNVELTIRVHKVMRAVAPCVMLSVIALRSNTPELGFIKNRYIYINITSKYIYIFRYNIFWRRHNISRVIASSMCWGDPQHHSKARCRSIHILRVRYLWNTKVHYSPAD